MGLGRCFWRYSGDAFVRLYWRYWGEIVPGDNFYLPSQVSYDLVLDGLLPSADSLIYVSVITVKFNEAVDFSSIFDVVNW